MIILWKYDYTIISEMNIIEADLSLKHIPHVGLCLFTGVSIAIINIERSYANCILQESMDKKSLIFWKNKNWESFLFKHLNLRCDLQKQPFRGVPKKSYSENMHQIYRRTPMPKCDFNKVALTASKRLLLDLYMFSLFCYILLLFCLIVLRKLIQ